MTLAERLSRAKPSRTGLPCAVGVLLKQLPKAEASALEEALAVPKGDPRRLSAKTINNALREEGYAVGDRAVANHRNGACRCDLDRALET